MYLNFSNYKQNFFEENEIISLFIYNLNLCYYNRAMKAKNYAVEASTNKIYMLMALNVYISYKVFT